MSLYFQTDMNSLMCGLQSRERWSTSLNTLDSCLGEKTEHQANFTRVAVQQSIMTGAGSASLGMASTGHQEGWTECFQDLQTWCPPAQDELNTPQVTTECFNFGTIDQGQARNSDDLYPVDLLPDSLGGDMALLKSPFIVKDEENNDIDTPPFLTFPQTYVAGTFPSNTKSPLKSTSANILLSQSIVNQPMMNKGEKYGPEPELRIHDGLGVPYDLEDEENYLLSVPPEQVAKRIRDSRVPSRMEVPVKKERPQLKLDITLPTPTQPIMMPSTPEVLQNVLSEPNVGFDLIKYVGNLREGSPDNNGWNDHCVPKGKVGCSREDPGERYLALHQVSGDYVNLGTVCTQVPKYESVERDHDYIDPVVRPKSEPSSSEDWIVKSEPLSPGACAATATLIENKIRITERGRPFKRRSDSDFVFDSEISESDNSVDWEPTTSKGKPLKIKKARISKSSEQHLTNTRAESDVESVGSSCNTDKYRELRDKNNEASRRSRLNRKQRDMEMVKTSEKLESDNRALKARAERMQRLVLDMREIIMKTVKGANKR